MADNNSNAPIVTTAQQPQKLESVIDVVARIEKFAAAESRGGIIPEEFFTLKDQMDLFAIGLKKTVSVGLVTAFLTPLLLGVFEKIIPVFGHQEPTLSDEVLGLALTVGFPLSYSWVVYRMGRFYVGAYTKKMINNFLYGIYTGAVLKLIAIFVLFHFLAIFVLQEKGVAKFLYRFEGKVSMQKLEAIFQWLMSFREVLIHSAYWVAATTLIIQIGIPVFSVLSKQVEEKKKAKRRARS